MKTKIVESYTYHGLGWPIQLTNVEMVLIDGEWYPKIDVLAIAKAEIQKMGDNYNLLSKAQKDLIRGYQRRHNKE